MITVRPLLVTAAVSAAMLVIFATGALAAQEYSLEDLYGMAIKRSERIKISGEELFIAEKGKDKAVSVLLPTLSAFGSYTRFSGDKYAAAYDLYLQPDYAMSWGLRLDQSLSLSGREFKSLHIANEKIEKSKYDFSATKENYLAGVATAYYDALRAQKAVEIAVANRERLTKHRDAAAVRLKVGEVTKTDLLRAEAELSGAMAELVRAENRLKLAKAVLGRVVGLTGDFTLRESPMRDPAPDQDPDLLKGVAFNERAELGSLELQKTITQDQVKYAQGAYWPTLSLEGVYQRENQDPASPLVLGESVYGGVMLNFPFFEGGLRRAEVSEAKARQREAELYYEDMRKTVAIEVEDAYLDFQTQKGVLASLEDQLRFAQDNYNSIEKQYEFGIVNNIDVIDANTLLLTAERQLADVRYSYQLSAVRLEKATGTLLKTVVSGQPSLAGLKVDGNGHTGYEHE